MASTPCFLPTFRADPGPPTVKQITRTPPDLAKKVAPFVVCCAKEGEDPAKKLNMFFPVFFLGYYFHVYLLLAILGSCLLLGFVLAFEPANTRPKTVSVKVSLCLSQVLAMYPFSIRMIWILHLAFAT